MQAGGDRCSNQGMKRVLPPLLLVVLLVAFRPVRAAWPEALPGFDPFAAVCFCLAACVGVRWLWVPLLAWLVSYPLTNSILGYSWDWQALVPIAGFAVVAGLGWVLRKHRTALSLLAGATGAAVLFYLVGNTGAWALLPYEKSWGGFVQAQTIGLTAEDFGLEGVVLPPTWVFLKNAVLGNLLFTGLFLLGQRQWRWNLAPSVEPAPVRVRR